MTMDGEGYGTGTGTGDGKGKIIRNLVLFPHRN